MILGLNHVQITVPNDAEDAAREFYCKLLGLREIPKPESLRSRGGFWMEAGNFRIHVGTEETSHRSSSKAHVAYEVENLEFWRQILVENAIDVIDGIAIQNYRRFEFRDPFGNRVEFLEQADNG